MLTLSRMSSLSPPRSPNLRKRILQTSQIVGALLAHVYRAKRRQCCEIIRNLLKVFIFLFRLST